MVFREGSGNNRLTGLALDTCAIRRKSSSYTTQKKAAGDIPPRCASATNFRIVNDSLGL